MKKRATNMVMALKLAIALKNSIIASIEAKTSGSESQVIRPVGKTNFGRRHGRA